MIDINQIVLDFESKKKVSAEFPPPPVPVSRK